MLMTARLSDFVYIVLANESHAIPCIKTKPICDCSSKLEDIQLNGQVKVKDCSVSNILILRPCEAIGAVVLHSELPNV